MKYLRYSALTVFFICAAIAGRYFYSEYRVAEILRQEIRTPATDNLPPAELDEVWGQDQIRIADFIAKDSVETAQRNKQGSVMRRDAHPKHHGCVRAKLRIENSQLPERYRVGLFSGLVWTEKDAWVRFSNGDPAGAAADDKNADVRGMAVKILDVPGSPRGNQDLVMMTSESFFSQNGEDYLNLVTALGEGKLALLSYMAFHPRNFSIIRAARIDYDNPLLIQYSSAVPYKLGTTSMRFRMVPCMMSAAREVGLSYHGTDPMQEDLKKSVALGSSCFDFQVQPNQDLERNPTEDPRRIWSQDVSPYYSVGSLTILQDAHFGEYGNFCENISFNPWNSVPENRPLGQINRIRQQAYQAMSKFRHDFNGAPELEPRDLEPCQNPQTAALCNR